MVKRSPLEIQSILRKIPPESETILVGGQAINLWAIAYQEKIPKLQDYLPFSSEDLDFIGGKIEAVEFQEQLGGVLNFPESFSPSPNTAVLTTKIEEEKLRVDFLANAYGLNTDEITKSAILFNHQTLPGIEIKVLNPILCLEGKLKSYVGLPQFGRQDKKHLQIAILIAKEYTKEVCQTKQARMALNLIERLGRLAKSEDGLKVWQQAKIDILATIPAEEISSLSGDKWQQCRDIRLPQLITEITNKRERYQKIVEQQTLRKQNRNRNKDLEL